MCTAAMLFWLGRKYLRILTQGFVSRAFYTWGRLRDANPSTKYDDRRIDLPHVLIELSEKLLYVILFGTSSLLWGFRLICESHG